MIKLKISNKVKKEFVILREPFQKWLKKAQGILAELKTLDGILELDFVDEKEIQELNLAYRGKDKVTDVLSFSFLGQESFPGDNLVGQIAICVKIAQKQAEAHGWSLEEELEFLFVHGLLHVCGFDHENPQDFEKMFALHAKIMPDVKWRTFIEQIRAESF